MKDQNISDEYLNSFVDNQLESAEKIRAYEFIKKDDTLKDRVCELSSLKEMMQHVYSCPPTRGRRSTNQPYTWSSRLQALAACLLLLLGGLSGWFSHAWSSKENGPDMATMIQSSQNATPIADTRKVIVHLSNSNPQKLKAALDETEGLLDNYKRANHQIQVEVIANKQGVDLLRANVSVHEKRINQLQQKYPNLSFLVCGKTIAKLRNEGENVQLLPHTGIATSAADQINKRLHQGWGYVRI
ncbi:MAG: hypothetical protein B7Y56_08590 [Gallionellales bacterium 35-53-114]|jgi:intracellular sulfur oxidation DsrE/DsrF family protein|nr:MAG: hypothetical protein B7Y56_08590 [Gallionellales bacterium 35-53-114]OYZ62683.1 MAG: hypothetical protein B7Y04_12445 [Gallionellales bacterium 24-53-125]OZB09758.1 MAG: hypothetical protein B7X61_04345 [Gallionellales bacterium 39-52-133]HQS57679.1 hypothetical protein [Gallionellaceae bacterium]HQS74133.1 hypothetical protein [Gallionellaceae bacterium]